MFGDMTETHTASLDQHNEVTPDILMPCYMVNNLSSITEEQCKFMIDNKCLEDDSLIDYVSVVYCDIGHEFRHFSMVLLMLLVIVLFSTMASIADEFLCPSLITVVKNLRMSDSLAGVTLLAFGNACPDIFSSLAAASGDRSKLIVGELLGAGIFCTSVVSGIIFVKHQFRLACRPVLRDTTFYLLAVYLIWYYCYDGEITFYRSLTFIVIYIVYLIVALGGQAINSRFIGDYPIAEQQTQIENSENEVQNENWYKWREESLRRKQIAQQDKKLEKLSLTSPYSTIKQPNDRVDHRQLSGSSQVNSNFIISSGRKTSSKSLNDIKVICMPPFNKTSSENGFVNKAFVFDKASSSFDLSDLLNDQVKRHAESVRENLQKQPEQVMSKQLQVLENSTSRSTHSARASFLSYSEIEELISHLNPIDASDWADSGLMGKFSRVIRAPLVFLAKLTVPVVDRDKPNNNWCRLLSSIHCITVPMVLTWVTNRDDDWILFGLPFKIYALIVGFCIALVLLKTTEPNQSPRYHFILAYVGFFMSITWTYMLASDIIGLLKTVGIMFSMSDTAIGLGILAWGNSLGDIMSNTSLADAGYPRMAIGASIGAPLLNLLLGFGLAFSLSLKPGQASLIEYSPTITLLCLSLAIILLVLMASTLVPAHKSRRPFGFILICSYGVFFVFAVILEYDMISFW